MAQQPHSAMGGARYGCDTGTGQPNGTASPQANEHPLVQIWTAPAPDCEPDCDVRNLRAGVRARRDDHANLARSTEVVADESRLNLLDRSQRNGRGGVYDEPILAEKDCTGWAAEGGVEGYPDAGIRT